MNQYITGTIIRTLREKMGLTQAELAEKLFVSDKAVSKWENGKGCPDISMLEPIAGVFGVSVSELITGRAVMNANISGNMLRSKFYICPVCGNVIHSMGEAVISCHGVLLEPAQAREADEAHGISIECVEDEYFIRIAHDMTKEHYISFACAVSPDRSQMVRFYPEGNPEARFKMNVVKRIYFYCSCDGLYYVNVGRTASRPGNAARQAFEAAMKKLYEG